MTPTDSQPSPPHGLLRRTLHRRWAQLLTQWAILSIALVYSAQHYLPTSVYRASCLLRIDPSSTDLYNLGTNRESLDPFMQTQIQLILSNNVLSAAGTNPKAVVLPRIQTAGDVVLELRKVLQAQIIPETYLIEVAMNSSDPREAATLVNAVVDAYIEANSEWSDGATKSQVRSLESYLSDLKKQTDDLERRWKELATRADSRSQGKPTLPGGPDHHKRLQGLRIENDVARLQASAQIEALRNRGDNQQVRIAELELQVATANLLDKALSTRLNSAVVEEPGKNPVNDVDIALIQEQRKNLVAMQETVFRRLEQLRFEAKGEARVRAVNPAFPPSKPIRPDFRSWLLPMIPFLTFFGLLGWFMRIEARSPGLVAGSNGS